MTRRAAAHHKELLKEYDRRLSTYTEACRRAQSLIADLLTESGAKTHSITSRVKTRDSLIKKLQLPEKHYESLSAVTDLVGLRIITYFSDEVDKIALIIRNEFDIDETNSVDKRQMLDPDRFGYLSFHFIATFSQARRQLPEYSRFSKFFFEIQIRSILQHAWAEIEHDLGYKTPSAVPREVRRQFARLASLLELADEEFVGIRNSLEQYQDDVEERISADPEQVLINKDSVESYVSSSVLVRRLDSDVAHGLRSELALTGRPNDYSENLGCVGIATIADLERALQLNKKRIGSLARWLGRSKDDDWLGDTWVSPGISLFYLCYVLVVAQGDSAVTASYLRRFNIGGLDPTSFVSDLLEWWRSQEGAEPE